MTNRDKEFSSKRGEIDARSKEVYRNKEYKNLPSWQSIIETNQDNISSILSIKIAKMGQDIRQYNIETPDHYTNITTHQGLDLLLTQVDKKTKERVHYSPYSNPAYEVFMYLACAYHKFYGKKPTLSFPDTDSKQRNEQNQHHDLPLINEMYNIMYDWGVSTYIDHDDMYEIDEDGVRRLMAPNPDIPQQPGIGIKDNTVTLYLRDFMRNKDGKLTKVYIPKEAIHIFMQALIDVNRSVSGGVINLHMKKMAEALYDTLSVEKSERGERALFKNMMSPLHEE